MALGLLPVKGSGEDMQVSGFASLPTCCRGTRGYQHFFVNGRYEVPYHDGRAGGGLCQPENGW